MQFYSLGSSRMVVPLPSSMCLAEGNRIFGLAVFAFSLCTFPHLSTEFRIGGREYVLAVTTSCDVEFDFPLQTNANKTSKQTRIVPLFCSISMVLWISSCFLCF